MSTSTRTDNLNLYLPTDEDIIDVAELSYNFEAIDTALAAALPAVTSSDNGKFLRVVDGEWAAATIANANGVST